MDVDATAHQLRTDRITAHLVPGRGTRGGFSLVVDGTTQSHVNPRDPLDLQLEYVRILAEAIDAYLPAGPLRVLVLGAGALTIPRYLAAARPGSRQHVVELFGELYEFVQTHLPLEDEGLTEEITDARIAVDRLVSEQAAFDLVIVDVYAGDHPPPHIGTKEFYESCAGVLSPEGVLVANTLSKRDPGFARGTVATVGAVLPHVIAAGAEAVLTGEGAGNVIVIAGRRPLAAGELGARVQSEPRRIQVLEGSGLDVFAAHVPVRMDAPSG